MSSTPLSYEMLASWAALSCAFGFIVFVVVGI